MDHQFIYTSLTRISDLSEKPFSLKKLDRSQWETGDYIGCIITDRGSNALSLELANGRMRGVIGGEKLIGALGERFATLEATGTWKAVGRNLKMNVLTGAGLLGKLTSKSVFIPNMMEVVYAGHVLRNDTKVTMDDFVPEIPFQNYKTPTILFVGTSMSAGKTTSARIVTHMFKAAGLKVIAAKLTGAGRFKDILAIRDVGADFILDFVDVGLPSSICDREKYKKKLEQMLSTLESKEADMAIIEIGASPLEPYNGDIAINAIRDQVKCTVLCASDPYAVYGLMKAFDIKPDIVTGIATNTLAGRDLVETLCGIKALNMIDTSASIEIRKVLEKTTGIKV